jgi:FtsP/CotA-like multicopper oxidase with cupredoxin domain
MTRAMARAGKLAVVVTLAALVAPAAPAQLAAAAPNSDSGIVCTPAGADGYDLYATAGFVGTPDGNTILMWSYSPTAPSGSDDGFQLPGPVLCVQQGDTVVVTLHNMLPEDTSVTFPGQTDVRLGSDPLTGTPVAPEFDGAELTSVTTSVAPGAAITYSFAADHAGTYLYESGTDQAKQLQMGLYGALVVRPADAATVYGAGTTTEFDPSTEFVLLMSEVDPDLHQAVERGGSGSYAYDPAAYHPRYWMLNGRSFPDTIAPNGAPWLPNQPYSSMIHIEPTSPGVDGAWPTDGALVRYLSVSTRSHPFHPHGNHGRVVGRDGRQTGGGAAGDLSNEMFLVDVGPGQTWEVIYSWEDVEHWNPDTNPIPVPIPQQQDTTYKDDLTWYAGSPYLGVQDELPVGVTSLNECGEYYQMWHSHALNESANYDAGFGGMMTLERIDPPGHFGCQP